MRHLPWPERFWNRVQIIGPDECWTWRGGVDKCGYGVLRHEERQYQAHRMMMILGGVSIEGLAVHHRCENRLCCNPAHLEAIPHGEHLRKYHVPGLIQNLRAGQVERVVSCRTCGEEFTTEHRQRVFCSTRCKEKNDRQKYGAKCKANYRARRQAA